MKDKALLPIQLDGLDELVDDLDDRRSCRTPAISCRGRAGEPVAAALRDFLA